MHVITYQHNTELPGCRPPSWSPLLPIEHDVVPGFVTTTVFFSTLLSLLTLTVLLTLI